LVLNLHLAIALVAGVFILVLGATGSILAFEPQLDRLLHWLIPLVAGQANADPWFYAGRVVLKWTAVGLLLPLISVARKYPGEPVVAYLPSDAADSPIASFFLAASSP
jgi:uncharacterized iron-regulated membrane protein